jgi:phosphoglycolate phosphatase-like HAD superfamily hydrolase
MIAEHRRTGGVSRFAKLEWFYRELARVEAAGPAIAAALERFAAAARAGLRTCPSVPGVEIYVPELARAAVRMHVISGGEQGELREALQARAWSKHFAGIHGSPTPKREHLVRLFASGELVREGVYFGDAELDMQLAEQFGLDFVFVAGVSDWAEGRVVARARGHQVIDDFLALLRPC